MRGRQGCECKGGRLVSSREAGWRVRGRQVGECEGGRSVSAREAGR